MKSLHNLLEYVEDGGTFFFFFWVYKKLDGKYGEDYFKLQY